MTWYGIKLAISQWTTVDMDALHVVVGMLAVLLTAAVLRRSLGDWSPWLIILAAELLNEWSDLHVEQWPDLGAQLDESGKDILLTIALPTLLMLVSRHRPTLLLRTRPPDRDMDP